MITQRERFLIVQCLELHTDGGGLLDYKELDDWLLEEEYNGRTAEELLSADADQYSKERLKLMESSDYRAQLATEGKL